jgi:hypothetical protein
MNKSYKQDKETLTDRKPLIIGLSIASIIFLVIIIFTHIKNRESSTPFSSRDSIAVADPDKVRQREQEEKERQRRALQNAQAIIDREYRNNWRKYINYRENDFEVGFFGGISNLEITVSNNTESILDEVVVKVNYIKESGDLWESKEVVINNIQPGTNKSAKAPETSRGIKIKTEIVKISAKSLSFCFDSKQEKERKRRNPKDPWLCR